MSSVTPQLCASRRMAVVAVALFAASLVCIAPTPARADAMNCDLKMRSACG